MSAESHHLDIESDLMSRMLKDPAVPILSNQLQPQFPTAARLISTQHLQHLRSWRWFKEGVHPRWRSKQLNGDAGRMRFDLFSRASHGSNDLVHSIGAATTRKLLTSLSQTGISINRLV